MTLLAGSEPPVRLIDPEGEGVYMLAGNQDWGLREIAWEFYADARGWRWLDLESVWMREDDNDHWHRVPWRWWYGLLLSRWCPTLYHYVTPRPEAM